MSMTKEELLEEARRRYPIGTTFKCLHDCGGGPVLEDLRFEHDPYQVIRWYGSKGGCGCIYDKGDWAEVVSYSDGYVSSLDQLMASIDERIKILEGGNNG